MKDIVDKAFEVLKGYCSKRTSCDGCRYDNQGVCELNENVPVDWKKPKNEKELWIIRKRLNCENRKQKS